MDAVRRTPVLQYTYTHFVIVSSTSYHNSKDYTHLCTLFTNLKHVFTTNVPKAMQCRL